MQNKEPAPKKHQDPILTENKCQNLEDISKDEEEIDDTPPQTSLSPENETQITTTSEP